jgi:hypothetical protein
MRLSVFPRNDRAAFQEATRTVIGRLPPDAVGPCSVDRTLWPIWLSFFHPPDIEEDMRPTRWGQARSRPSRLVERESDEYDRLPRPTHYRDFKLGAGRRRSIRRGRGLRRLCRP